MVVALQALQSAAATAGESVSSRRRTATGVFVCRSSVDPRSFAVCMLMGQFAYACMMYNALHPSPYLAWPPFGHVIRLWNTAIRPHLQSFFLQRPVLAAMNATWAEDTTRGREGCFVGNNARLANLQKAGRRNWNENETLVCTWGVRQAHL